MKKKNRTRTTQKATGNNTNVLKGILLVLTLVTFIGAFSFLGFKVYQAVQNVKEASSSSSSKKDISEDDEVDLGKAEFVIPALEDSIETDDWGFVANNQIIAVFKDDTNQDDIDELVDSIEGEIVGEMTMINMYQIEIPSTTEDALMEALEIIQEDGQVETAFPNTQIVSKDITGAPCTPLTDPVFGNPDQLRPFEMIGMVNAWKILKASCVELNDVQVGVLDSSIYTGSNEIGGNVKIVGDTTSTPEQDNNGTVVDDGLNHGTMVTHVIGANANNGGVVGIASILGEGLEINVSNLYDGKPSFSAAAADAGDITKTVKDGNGATYVVKALQKLKEQVDNGATVINCSYGPELPNPNCKWIAEAYKKFFNKIHDTHPNVIFVAAAGNEAQVNGALDGSNYYPGGLKLPNVVTVGALNNDGSQADFSNFQTGDAEVTISAPGVNIVMGVDADGNPVKASGTSFAAPQVTSAIALMQAVNPDLTSDEIKKILAESAAPGVTNGDHSIPIPSGFGAGVLRIDNAVLAAINTMRVKEGLSPYTLDELLEKSKVNLVAKGGGNTFTVEAKAPGNPDDAVDLVIEVTGQDYVLTGDTTQTVSSDYEATWEIEFTQETTELYVKVTRLDSENCSTLKLVKGDFEGEWDSQLSITSDTLSPLLIKVLGEMIEGMATEMGCEVDENGEVKVNESQLNYIFNIAKTDDSGKNYSFSIAPKDPNNKGLLDYANEMGAMDAIVNDNGELVVDYVKTGDGITLHMQYTAKIVGEDQLEGTFLLYLEGTMDQNVFSREYAMEGTWVGTRIKEGQ